MTETTQSDSIIGRPAWGSAVAALVVCEIVMIALAFLWVAIYAYLIHPGEEAAFYESYALVASPWVALLTGIPMFWLAGRWIRRRFDEIRARSTAVTVMALWVTMEIVVFAIADASVGSIWLLWTANFVTKSGAIAWGVRQAVT